MKTGSFLLALLFAGSALGAQESATIPAQRAETGTVTPRMALDSAAVHADQVMAAEFPHGAEGTRPP